MGTESAKSITMQCTHFFSAHLCNVEVVTFFDVGGLKWRYECPVCTVWLLRSVRSCSKGRASLHRSPGDHTSPLPVCYQNAFHPRI